jgi:hypothetical protein
MAAHIGDITPKPELPPPGLLVSIEVTDTRTDRKLTSQKLISEKQWDEFEQFRVEVLRAYLTEQSDAVMAAAREQGVV